MSFYLPQQILVGSPQQMIVGGSRILAYPSQQQQVQVIQSQPQGGICSGYSSPLTRSNLHILQEPNTVYYRSPSSLSNQFPQNQQTHAIFPQQQQLQQQNVIENAQISQKQPSFHSHLQSSRLTMQSMPATLTHAFDAGSLLNKNSNRQQQSPQVLLSRAQSPPQQKLRQQIQQSAQASGCSPSSRGQSPTSSRNGLVSTSMSVSQGNFCHKNIQGFQQMQSVAQTQQQFKVNQQINSLQSKYQPPANLEISASKMAENLARSEKLKKQAVKNDLLSRESEEIHRDFNIFQSQQASHIKQKGEPGLFFEDSSPFKNFTSQSALYSVNSQPSQHKSQPVSSSKPNASTNEYEQSNPLLGVSSRAFSQSTIQKREVQAKVPPSAGFQNILKQMSGGIKDGSTTLSFQKGQRTENQDDDLDSTLHWLDQNKQKIDQIRQEFQSQVKFIQAKVSQQDQQPIIPIQSKSKTSLNQGQKQQEKTKQGSNQKKKVQPSNNNENQAQFSQNNETNKNKAQAQPNQQSNSSENKQHKDDTPALGGKENANKKFLSRVNEHRQNLESKWNKEDINIRFGKKELQNGLIYVGAFVNDKPNGYGVLKDGNNHELYKGDWSNGQYDGCGILFQQVSKLTQEKIHIDIRDLSKAIKQGIWSRYEGEFKDNIIQGFGTLLFQNGDKIVGTFSQGIPNGQCSFYAANGSVCAALYEKGKLTELLWN